MIDGNRKEIYVLLAHCPRDDSIPERGQEGPSSLMMTKNNTGSQCDQDRKLRLISAKVAVSKMPRSKGRDHSTSAYA